MKLGERGYNLPTLEHMAHGGVILRNSMAHAGLPPADRARELMKTALANPIQM